jgi:DNA invertase Pin-like site-specific DNA recombinase
VGGYDDASRPPNANRARWLAEFERELIRARTDDGRKRARARGVRFGRPLKLTAHQRREVIQRLAEGAVQADLARTDDGVSQATISRLAGPGSRQARSSLRCKAVSGFKACTHKSRLVRRSDQCPLL